MNQRRSIFLFTIFLCAFLLAGCGSRQEMPVTAEVSDTQVQSTYVEPMADSYDEALLVDINTDESTIRFYNLQAQKTYTLQYDSATRIKNRHGDELVAGQLSCGDPVHITFKNAMILSGGSLLEANEIQPADTLKVVSKDHQIMGITVERGHGYVRLSGQDNFVDGFVEIGTAVIKRVTEEMLLVVPEGDYTLYISKNGMAGSEDISVKAGEETLVDVSKFEVNKDKETGKIIFTISPAKAELYIDQEKTLYDEPVELTCGIHQIRVQADGYKTLTQYIKVGTATANLNVELEESDGKDTTSTVTPSVSKNSIDASDGYRVYIEAPTSAELYVDGAYVGIIPTDFAKKEGTHIISLRKDGCQTRSYTLEIDDTKKDVRYSFSDLVSK